MKNVKDKLFYSTFSKLLALCGILFVYVILFRLFNLVKGATGLVFVCFALLFTIIVCFNYTITIVNFSKRNIRTISVVLLPVKIKEESFDNFDKVILKPFNRNYAIASGWNIFLQNKSGELLPVCYKFSRTLADKKGQQLSEALALAYKKVK